MSEYGIITSMSQQQRKPKLAIADVPVKISFIHDKKLLKEYEDIVPVAFDPQTTEGDKNAHRMGRLWKEGLSTESALFEIASDHVRKHTVDIVSSLSPKITKPIAGQSLHVRVKRNGEITYRAMQL